MMINYHSRKGRRNKGQALVELALTLPIFLVLVFGIFEFGRLIFVYSSVLNASREAARYAEAVGKNSEGIEYYRDCEGIEARAQSVSTITILQSLTITYEIVDPTSGGTETYSCPLPSNKKIKTGDQVTIMVTATFNPVIPINSVIPVLNVANIPISSSTTRSFITEVDIWNP